MKQVLIKQGRVVVEEVPTPMVGRGNVLVRVDHSCISVGTEMSGIEASGTPLWKRAIKQPENVKQVVGMVVSQGIVRTRSQIEGKLLAGDPTGYSAAGTVLEVGKDIKDIRPGDRVACAGAQCAHHAEIINVPRKLTVLVPDTLDFPAASTVTLGAIALQGVRRAQPTLGETFVIIGLGVLGQLTVQILRANGCRVIGTDLDKSRIQVAKELGMEVAVYPENGNEVEQVARFTDGIGADGAIITAATPEHTVISTAFCMCRKKGRVVLVGDVGLHLNRDDLYEKELDFFISTSYGPGRYDSNYEEKGLDYPVAYVRWTENRNMAEYLRLVDKGKIAVGPLISAIYTIDEAPLAYEALRNRETRPLMVLLSYPQSEESAIPRRMIINPTTRPSGPGLIQIAVVGAGEFARGTHLPNLKVLSDRYHLRAVMSRTGRNATAASRQFGADYATTDYQQILDDAEVDAVLIATRHSLHASMTIAALKAGKHVFVEKPLAVTQKELNEIEDFYTSASSGQTLPVLLTGFNRRFSPFAQRIEELTRNRSGPMILSYSVNAGYVPLDNWVHTEEGGGRNIGEACHIYDLFTYLSDSKVVAVDARAIRPTTSHYCERDNFVATMTFSDGSVATLTYTALGTTDYPKERLEVFVDGKVMVLDYYRLLTIFGAKIKGIAGKVVDKGHKKELEAFALAIQHGGEWPIPLWQQVQATEIALQVEEQITGKDERNGGSDCGT